MAVFYSGRPGVFDRDRYDLFTLFCPQNIIMVRLFLPAGIPEPCFF